jgi:hypothetical protein
MVDYWHGSPVAFEVGTRLAPKREREGARLSETQYQHLVDNLHNPDLVYFTTDRELARARVRVSWEESATPSLELRRFRIAR